MRRDDIQLLYVCLACIQNDIDQGVDVSWSLQWLEEKVMHLYQQQLLSKNDMKNLMMMVEDVLKSMKKALYFEKCMERYYDYI